MNRSLSPIHSIATLAPARATSSLPSTKQKLLEAFNLEERRSRLGILLPGVGLIAAGVIAGAGLMLLLAPARVLARTEST